MSDVEEPKAQPGHENLPAQIIPGSSEEDSDETPLAEDDAEIAPRAPSAGSSSEDSSWDPAKPENINRPMVNRLTSEHQRKPGDPLPFDYLLVGGTFSLVILLIIGGIVILAISLAENAQFDGAALNDFKSIGPEACLIQSSASYSIVQEDLDKLNSLCKERYEYNVFIERYNTSFVSNPLYSTACKTSCDICGPSNFKGKNHYVGVEVNQEGERITSKTLVECWEPAIDDLSSYYECSDENCYQVADPSLVLDAEMKSTQKGIIAGIVGLVGSVVMGIIGLYFVWKNRQARESDRKALEEAAAGAAEAAETSSG